MTTSERETLTSRLDALERRVAALEDELAIHRLIVSYGFAVDTGDASATAALFTEDTVYDVDTTLVMRGRDGVADMVRGPRHQSLLPNCAHTIGPAVVQVDGERALATAYSRIYLRRNDELALWRLSFNRFELVRREGRWQIARRTTRLLGHAEAQELLARALHPASG
ncbi:MAG: nuclear transport factor 2 family protein [Thermodesulfobacteriota bacterium]